MDFNEVGEHDASRHRVFAIKDRTGKEMNAVHAERRDPYGFWHVWLEHGTFPDKSPLHGVYNNFEMMESHIRGYIQDRNDAVSAIREKTLGPMEHVKEAKVA